MFLDFCNTYCFCEPYLASLLSFSFNLLSARVDESSVYVQYVGVSASIHFLNYLQVYATCVGVNGGIQSILLY